MKGWNIEWPDTSSVSIALPVEFYVGAPPVVTGIAYRLVMYIAREGVNSAYSNAESDPSLPSSPKELRKIAQCTKAAFEIAMPYLDAIFSEKNGRLRLREEGIVRYTRPVSRSAIAKDAKLAVMAREGMRCVYCGSIAGPFHFDHIFPVARGGTNEPSNLVIACAWCNSSKRDSTLVEWVSVLRDGVRE